MPSIFADDIAHAKSLTRRLADVTAALPVKNAETLAKAVYGVLREFAKAEGQNPDIEVAIRKPGEPRHFASENSWCVVWEAGPYEWAIPASMAIGSATGKLTEPYYSFDLCFYPSED